MNCFGILKQAAVITTLGTLNWNAVVCEFKTSVLDRQVLRCSCRTERRIVDEREESFTSERDVRSSSTSALQKVHSAAKKLRSLIWKPESPASKLTFHIIALNKVTVVTVKESLQARLEALVNKTEIRSDAVASLSREDELTINALQSTDVGIQIGQSACLLSSWKM